jgi:hypothetical protein
MFSCLHAILTRPGRETDIRSETLRREAVGDEAIGACFSTVRRNLWLFFFH